MLRFLLCLVYPILLIPLYLDWSRQQAEAQIDKMQRAVFNSPGAAAPVPPWVLVIGVGLMAGYLLVGKLLRVPGWWRLLAAFLGVPVGVAVYILRQSKPRR